MGSYIKHIVCFSGGHSSALVAVEVVRRFGASDTILLNHDIHPSVEDSDIKRFKREVSEKLGIPITFANYKWWDERDPLDIALYHSAFKAYDKTALCSHRLKTEPFQRWLKENFPSGDSCVIYYGFDANEKNRIQRRAQILGAQGYKADFPLAFWPRTIQSTHEIGIAPPLTYSLFRHANCTGCLKAGRQHWYVVYCTRRDLFEKAKRAETEIGYTIINGVSMLELESLFARMSCAGIEASEKLPAATFWAKVRAAGIDTNADPSNTLPCECVDSAGPSVLAAGSTPYDALPGAIDVEEPTASAAENGVLCARGVLPGASHERAENAADLRLAEGVYATPAHRARLPAASLLHDGGTPALVGRIVEDPIALGGTEVAKVHESSSQEVSMITAIGTNLKIGADVRLGPKTLIVGPKGSGKSTIVNAIELALTGRCGDVAGRDDVGSGAELWSLAPEGHDEIHARVTWDAQRWARGEPPVESVWGMAEGKKPIRSGRAGILPLREVHEALTGSAETTRKWLLQFVGGRSWRDDLGGALAERARVLPDDLAAAIEGARQRGREARASATRMRAAVTAGSAGLPPEPSEVQIEEAQAAEDGARRASDFAGLRERLAVLEAERGALRDKLEVARTRLASLPPATDETFAMRAEAILAAMKAQIEAGVTRCAICGGSTKPAEVAERRAALLAKAKATLEVATARHEAVFAVSTIEADLKRIEREIAAIPPSVREAGPAVQPPAVSSGELVSRRARWQSICYQDQEAAKADREADEWQAIVDLLSLRLSQSVEDGRSAFEVRVQKYLPADMTFGISLAPVRVGLRRGVMLHTALSGAEWATVTLALALAASEPRTDGGDLVGPDRCIVAIPEERAFDPDTLRDVLAAWADAPVQIVMTSPIMPREVPAGWTVIERGEVRADTSARVHTPTDLGEPSDAGPSAARGYKACACPATASGRKRHDPGCHFSRRKKMAEASAVEEATLADPLAAGLDPPVAYIKEGAIPPTPLD